MQEAVNSERSQPVERTLCVAVTDLFMLDRYGQSIFVWKWVAGSGDVFGELWMSPDVDWQDSDNKLTMMAATLDASFDPAVGYPNSNGEQRYEVFRPAVLGKWLEVSYVDSGGFMSHVTGICPSSGPAPLDRLAPPTPDSPGRGMRLVW